MKSRVTSLILAVVLMLSLAVVPVAAASAPSVEITASTGATIVQKETPQTITFTVLLHNPQPSQSDIVGLDFSLKSNSSSLVLDTVQSYKTDKFSSVTYNSPKFVAINLDIGSLSTFPITEQEVTLLKINATLAANAEPGQYKIYTEGMAVSNSRAQQVYSSNPSLTINVVPPTKYTVSFDKNGGTGSMNSYHIISGEQYTLPSCSFTAPAEQKFKCWKVDSVEKAVGDKITITKDTTIVAVWQLLHTHSWSSSFKGHNATHHWKTCESSDCKITSPTQMNGYAAHFGGKATCEAKAKCTDCGQEYGSIGSCQYSDKYIDTNADANKHYKVCLVCGKKDNGEKHVLNASKPTQTTDVHCTICGYVVETALGHKHSLTKMSEVKATCKKGGNIEYYTCSCGKWFADKDAKTEITDKTSVNTKPLDHKYDDDNDAICNNCGSEREVFVNRDDTNVPETPPTNNQQEQNQNDNTIEEKTNSTVIALCVLGGILLLALAIIILFVIKKKKANTTETEETTEE